MTGTRILLALAPLALAACSGREQPVPATTASAAAAPLATPAPVPAAAIAAGCADAMTVSLKTDSFRAEEGRPFTSARLDKLSSALSGAFRTAANRQCRATPAVAKALAGIETVVVIDAAGAAEPTLYRAEGGPRGQLTFEYAFDPADLAVPDRADIELGLRCWADPARKDCADRGD